MPETDLAAEGLEVALQVLVGDVVDVAAESPAVALGQDEDEMQVGDVGGGQARTIVAGYLAEAAHVVEVGEVYYYGLHSQSVRICEQNCCSAAHTRSVLMRAYWAA